MAKELTPKQRRFVEAYAATGNATESARRAGYSGKDAALAARGSALLRIAKVSEAIATLTKPASNAAISTAEERQAWLTSVARGEVEEVYLIDGVPVPGPPRLKERIAANDQLNKMQVSYTEKREVEHIGVSVQVYLPSNGRD